MPVQNPACSNGTPLQGAAALFTCQIPFWIEVHKPLSIWSTPLDCSLLQQFIPCITRPSLLPKAAGWDMQHHTPTH